MTLWSPVSIERELDERTAEYLGERIPAFKRGISAAALMAKQFEPIRYTVSSYIAEGLTVLAGAPKIGKSWMALNIAVAVAGDRPAFGSVPCQHGDVLYLALEDNLRRLQGRLLKTGVDAPERLTFCTDWPTLADGAVAQIKTWAEQANNPTLVIVDVLAKVRDAANGRDSAYDGDYRTLTGLQALAGRIGLAIVAVQHTRKMDADDPFDSVSGTRGLTGAADTVLVLKRDSVTGRSILYGRGRDIEEIETAFEFNCDTVTWSVIGNASDLAKTDSRQEILDTLRASPNPLSPKEVADLLDRGSTAVRQTMTRMAHAGEIEKSGYGRYTCHTSHPVTPGPASPLNSDTVTGVTGDKESDDDERWIGESPAQSAARRGGCR